MHCLIRSLAQTLCDDLARAEKAKDGKKVAWQVELFSLHVSGRRQSNLKGGCATLFHFLAWRNQSFIFACLI